MKRLVLCAAIAMAALAGSARAQLIVGNDDSLSTGTNAWHVDLSDCTSTPLWGGGSRAWGLAVDDANGKIYATDGTPLTVWDYHSPNQPTPLGNPISSVDGASLLFTGLAFGNSTLYGLRSSSSTNNPEGIYTIDTNTLVATMILAFGPAADYDFGGLGYNPVDGLFYGTNDDSTPFGQGVFSIDALGAGAITFITAYDGGEIDVDGATVGNNKVYAVTDDAGDPLYNYDLATGTWDPNPCTSPMPTTEIFSSGGWAPSFGSPCPAPVSYCTAKTTSTGCTPAIGWVGTPTKSGGAGTFDVTLSATRPNKAYIYFYSINTARNAAPFQGGFLCMQPPVRRTSVVFTSNTGECTSGTSKDFGDVMASAGFIAAGDVIRGEWWGRDTSGNSSLSDAVEFTVCP